MEGAAGAVVACLACTLTCLQMAVSRNICTSRNGIEPSKCVSPSRQDPRSCRGQDFQFFNFHDKLKWKNKIS